MQKNSVTAGWPIPTDVKEAFVSFCAEKGTLVQEAAAAALLLYTHLPAQVREQAILESKGIVEPDLQFWQDFAAGLRQRLVSKGKGRHREKPPVKKTRDR